MVPLLTHRYLYILRWRLWPIQGPTGACGWAPNFNLRPFTLQARRQSSPPHPQSFSPRAPLMFNSPFWTLTQTTWIYTASGNLKWLSKIHFEPHSAKFCKGKKTALFYQSKSKMGYVIIYIHICFSLSRSGHSSLPEIILTSMDKNTIFRMSLWLP